MPEKLAVDPQITRRFVLSCVNEEFWGVWRDGDYLRKTRKMIIQWGDGCFCDYDVDSPIAVAKMFNDGAGYLIDTDPDIYADNCGELIEDEIISPYFVHVKRLLKKQKEAIRLIPSDEIWPYSAAVENLVGNCLRLRKQVQDRFQSNFGELDSNSLDGLGAVPLGQLGLLVDQAIEAIKRRDSGDYISEKDEGDVARMYLRLGNVLADVHEAHLKDDVLKQKRALIFNEAQEEIETKEMGFWHKSVLWMDLIKYAARAGLEEKVPRLLKKASLSLERLRKTEGEGPEIQIVFEYARDTASFLKERGISTEGMGNFG